MKKNKRKVEWKNNYKEPTREELIKERDEAIKYCKEIGMDEDSIRQIWLMYSRII